MQKHYLGNQVFNSDNIDKLSTYLYSYLDVDFTVTSILVTSKKEKYYLKSIDELTPLFKKIENAKHFHIKFYKDGQTVELFNSKYSSKTWYTKVYLERNSQQYIKDDAKVYLANKELKLFKLSNYETLRIDYFEVRFLYAIILVSILSILYAPLLVKLTCMGIIMLIAVVYIFKYYKQFYKNTIRY